MQNLITASNANITLDEAAISLGGGSSNNFTSKVSLASENNGKFNKIFEDTTRRQNRTAASNGDEAKAPIALSTSNNAVVESKAKPSGVIAQGQESQAVSTVENETATKFEIPQTAAVLDNIIETANAILAIPEIQSELELIGKINNLLDKVKVPEILTTQDLEQIQENFKVIVDEVKNVSGQSDETLSSELNNTKDVVIKTTDTNEEQMPAPKEQEAPLQTKRHAGNHEHAQQIQTKGRTIEVPREAVVNTKPDALVVSKDDIVDENGKTVKIEQLRHREQSPQTIDTNIIEELEASVEQVVVLKQTQPKDNKDSALRNALSASEHIIKLSIEDIGVKADTNAKDTGSNENSSKQDFHPEAFRLNLNTAAQSSTNNAPPLMPFNEAIKNGVLDQIGAKLEQLQQSGTGKITLALRPHDLGRVVIELTHGADGVTTNIITQNSSVKELLEKNIDALRQQLAQAGVNVQNINVKTADNGENSESKERNGHNKEEKQEKQEQGSKNSSEQKNNKKEE